MPEFAVTPIVRFDGTAGMTVVPGSSPVNAARDVNIFISRAGDHFVFEVISAEGEFPGEVPWRAEIPLTDAELSHAVSRCQVAWQQAVIKHKSTFGKRWNLSDRQDILDSLAPDLARAGARLFATLFPVSKGQTVSGNNGKLQEIRSRLLALGQRKPLRIRVTSKDFFAPWDLLYSDVLENPLKGTGAKWTGFWGFRHLIEHVPLDPNSASPARTLVPELPLRFGLHLDTSIDDELSRFGSETLCNSVVVEQLALYDSTALEIEPRLTSDELVAAFTRDPLEDQILYFCCHGTTGSDTGRDKNDVSSFWLTDSTTRIDAGDLNEILSERRFHRRPIVFLNACESATMTTLFYKGFATAFWNSGASAVIGTQTDIPGVFAGEFARRFFEEFFQGGLNDDGSPSRRVGDVLFKLRQEFLTRYNNPLGILYSLYRGDDVFLPQALPRTPSESSESESRPGQV